MSVLVSQSFVHHQLVDAYRKAITRYYQQLVTLLPIEDMMEDLMKGKIISHRQQVIIDSKHARAGEKMCVYIRSLRGYYNLDYSTGHLKVN